MKIKELYNKFDPISIETYLEKCGVDNVPKYLIPDSTCIEDCGLYSNMGSAHELFMHELSTDRTIYIIQDCDVDGLCSASMIYMYIKKMKPTQDIKMIFHTYKEHGISSDVKELIPNDCFVIIPDASLNTEENMSWAINSNIRVLQLDHHEIYLHSDNITDNIICINNQYGNIANKALSGAGVTHKFCQFVDRINHTNYADEFVDLVALSIISDVCSLLSLENRWYTYYGFKPVNPFYAYMVNSILYSKDKIVTPTNLSFNIVNLLNAVERSTNQSLKADVFNCMVGENLNFSSVLADCNLEKKTQDNVVKSVINNTEVNEDDNFLIIEVDGNDAYSGLLANKFMSKYLKPVFVVHKSNDNYVGSCRSPIGIRELLENNNLFNFNAGHSSAFGTSFPIDNLTEVKKFCNELELVDSTERTVVGNYNVNQIPKALFPLNKQYETIWGQDIPSPMISCHVECNGKDWLSMRGATIKLVVQNVSFIMFFVSNKQKEQWHIGEDTHMSIDIIGIPQYNEYNGVRSLQVQIQEMDIKIKDTITIDDIF